MIYPSWIEPNHKYHQIFIFVTSRHFTTVLIHNAKTSNVKTNEIVFNVLKLRSSSK